MMRLIELVWAQLIEIPWLSAKLKPTFSVSQNLPPIFLTTVVIGTAGIQIEGFLSLKNDQENKLDLSGVTVKDPKLGTVEHFNFSPENIPGNEKRDIILTILLKNANPCILQEKEINTTLFIEGKCYIKKQVKIRLQNKSNT